MKARLVAVAGAVAATGATTVMALVSGTAAAAPDATTAGRCTDNVNVRAMPDVNSDIVAVCERGQAVKVGEARDGFVRLADLDGWASAKYVSTGAARTPAAATTTPPRAADEPATTGGTAAGDEGTDDATATPAPDGAANGATPPRRSGLTDLLG
jgi:uncharacterized protein YraI